MRKLKIGECICCTFFIVISVCFLLEALSLGLTTRVLTNTQPGPGLYPFIVSVLIVLIGVLIILDTAIKWKTSIGIEGNDVIEQIIPVDEKKENAKIVLVTIFIILLTFVLWKYIGFFPSALFMCFFLSMIYDRNLPLSIILSVVAVGFVFLAFTYGLKIKFRI